MVIATMMLSAAEMPFSMLLVMLVTMHLGIKPKISCQQGIYRFICAAGHPAVKPDSGFFQSHLRACADPAADQGIHTQIREQHSQCTVAAPIGTYHL